MPSHIPFIDGDLSPSNRISAAWLNGVNNFIYTTLPGPGGAAEIGFTPADGGTPTSVWAALNEITQQPTNHIFPQDGAKVQRFNDRIMGGAATDSDLLFPNIIRDWWSDFQVSAGISNGSILNSQGAIMTNTSDSAAVGWLVASQSLHFQSAGTSCIGGFFAVVNNNASLNTNAWGVYIEAHKTTVAGASIYVIEGDVRTLVDSIAPTPVQQGDIIGIQLAVGAEMAAAGQFDASAAIQIVRNPKKWKVGINFFHDALTGASLGVGAGIAMALSINHYIDWYNVAGVRTFYVNSQTTDATKAAGLLSNNLGLFYSDNSGNPLGYIAYVASAANYPQMLANVAGQPVQFAAGGTDSNIDITLAPKGTGVVRFGAWTANADAPITGYITVKDVTTNTVRKLATI